MATGQRLGRVTLAVAGNVMVSVEDAFVEPGMTVAGLKLPDAPVGRPETLSATVPEKALPTSVTVMGYLTVAPGRTVCEGVVEEMLKSGAGTFTVTVRCTWAATM